ncbi:MAG: 3-hydroxyacyl-CoA dehydrogenase family protein [Thermodesulfobacteriota bacterium]
MKVENISRVVVFGAGVMGVGIAQSFAQAGLSVNLVDQGAGILDQAVSQIASNLRLFMEYDLLSEDPESIQSRIVTYASNHFDKAIVGCDFVVESISESLDLKRTLFGQLDSLPENIVLTSNTSSLTISAIAEGMRSAFRVAGLHYFNPAHIIPAVEIHRGRNTSEHALNLTRQLMLRVGKDPVLVRKEISGCIINRLQGAMEREIDYLLDEGIVTPEELDVAVKASYGFRLSCLGPMEAEDIIGLDLAARVSARIFKLLSNRTEPSPMLLEKVKKGEIGVKSGRGWYDYTGRSREEIADNVNRRLVRQLALYQARQEENPGI